MPSSLSRRQALSTAGLAAGAALLSQPAAAAPKNPFTLCLNMSTIMGQKLGFVKELETAAAAGFRSVEIWIPTLQTYLSRGGTLADARKRLGDLGIQVENAIGFAKWIVDDEPERSKGVEQLKREMDMVAQLGGRRIATPPMGATDKPGLDLRLAAERYRTILDLGVQSGVIPQLELWGFSQNLKRISEVLFVAAESGHPSARLLLDVYHIYKGGSSPDSLSLVGKPAVEIFHVNDYPNIAPATIVDADRVYPGDGIAPVQTILKAIKNPERPVVLSLEVFNKSYYAQDAALVAKTAMAKMKKMVEGV